MNSIHVIMSGDSSLISGEYARRAARRQLRECDRLTLCAGEFIGEAAAGSVCDILLFQSLQTIMSPGFLDAVRAAFEDGNVAAACGAFFVYTGAAFRMEDQIGVNERRFLDELEHGFDAFKYGGLFQLRSLPFSEDTREVAEGLFDVSRQYAARRAALEGCGGIDTRFCTPCFALTDAAHRMCGYGRFKCVDTLPSYYDDRRGMFTGDKSELSRDLYRYLLKYPDSDTELEYAFFSCGTPELKREINRLFGYLCENAVGCEALQAPAEEEICLLLSSPEHPQGRICVNKDGAYQQFELFGFIVPFESGAFKRAVISPLWALLPDILLARLLSEALRTADEVLLDRAAPAHPRFEDSGAFRLEWPIMFDRYYVEHTGVFDFTRRDERYIYVKWARDAYIGI